MVKPSFFRAKSWSWLIRQVGLLAGKYGNRNSELKNIMQYQEVMGNITS